MINFVVDLSNNNEYINIIIVVNRFIKLQYFIAFKFLDVETIIDVFIKNVFKLHRLSDTIISDCDNQFISTFWKILYTSLTFLHVSSYKIMYFRLVICSLNNFINLHLIWMISDCQIMSKFKNLVSQNVRVWYYHFLFIIKSIILYFTFNEHNIFILSLIIFDHIHYFKYS